MADPFIGEVRLVGFNFAPRGWVECNGTLLPIGNNSTLFSLLGTMYGGDGRSNFALPDLRGRSAVSKGRGLGFPIDVRQGQKLGNQDTTLQVANMPSHRHTLYATNNQADSSDPTNRVLAKPDAGFAGSVAAGIPVSGNTKVQGKNYALQGGQTSDAGSVSLSGGINTYALAAPNQPMYEDCIGLTGSGQAFLSQSPALGMLYVMAMQGIYPPRN